MRLDDGGKVLAVSYIRMRMSLAAVTLCWGGWKFCCNSWNEERSSGSGAEVEEGEAGEDLLCWTIIGLADMLKDCLKFLGCHTDIVRY